MTAVPYLTYLLGLPGFATPAVGRLTERTQNSHQQRLITTMTAHHRNKIELDIGILIRTTFFICENLSKAVNSRL